MDLEVYKFIGFGEVALSMYNTKGKITETKRVTEGLESLLVSGDLDFVLGKDGAKERDIESMTVVEDVLRLPEVIGDASHLSGYSFSVHNNVIHPFAVLGSKPLVIFCHKASNAIENNDQTRPISVVDLQFEDNDNTSGFYMLHVNMFCNN
ncbi:hypothetical protein Tco_0508975 [Tanacetum coccineum]